MFGHDLGLTSSVDRPHGNRGVLLPTQDVGPATRDVLDRPTSTVDNDLHILQSYE